MRQKTWEEALERGGQHTAIEDQHSLPQQSGGIRSHRALRLCSDRRRRGPAGDDGWDSWVTTDPNCTKLYMLFLDVNGDGKKNRNWLGPEELSFFPRLMG